MKFSFRRRPERSAPRHSAQALRERSPAEAAAFANALHGRPDTEDGLDVADALEAYAPEPVAWTAASPVHAAPGSQDPSMEAPFDPHATQPWTRPEDLQAARTRRYVALAPAGPRSRGLDIPLDQDIENMVRVAIAGGRYEDVEAYAADAARRAARRFDWARQRLHRRIDAGLRACMAIAAARRTA